MRDENKLDVDKVNHLFKDIQPPLPSIGQVKISLKRLKHALITPIAKVPNSCDIENDFHQVSILPQMDKILEKLQLQLNGPDVKVKNNQHAFIQERSNVSALISITQKCYDATDNSLSGKKVVHAGFF